MNCTPLHTEKGGLENKHRSTKRISRQSLFVTVSRLIESVTHHPLFCTVLLAIFESVWIVNIFFTPSWYILILSFDKGNTRESEPADHRSKFRLTMYSQSQKRYMLIHVVSKFQSFLLLSQSLRLCRP